MSDKKGKAQVLLLAAGVGSRLRPLTDHLPKCLMPICGKPLLEIWLESFWTDGIRDIVVNTHYLSNEVIEWVRSSRFDDTVTLVHEPELLGTGGTLLTNRASFWDGPIIVAHADNLTHFSPRKFLDAHRLRPDRTEMTMMTFRTSDPSSCGILELESDGVVRAFHEKVKNPPGNLANAAVYVFEPSQVFPRLEALGKDTIDLSTEVIPELVGKIFTYHNDQYHRDIGTVESLVAAQFEYAALVSRDESSEPWRRKVQTMAQLLPRFSL